MIENLYNIDSISFDGKLVKRTKQDNSRNIIWESSERISNKKLETVYSDRLHQWDWKKYNNCCKDIWGNESQYFDDRKPDEIEKFLSKYLNKEIKLHLVEEVYNRSNGFSLWRFDYQEL